MGSGYETYSCVTVRMSSGVDCLELLRIFKVELRNYFK
jgi:hypothetical protein